MGSILLVVMLLYMAGVAAFCHFVWSNRALLAAELFPVSEGRPTKDMFT